MDGTRSHCRISHRRFPPQPHQPLAGKPGFPGENCAATPILKRFFEHKIRRCKAKSGFQVDLTKTYWTPPLSPRMAFDLESGQISELGLHPLVSITDHDNIEAPILLQ